MNVFTSNDKKLFWRGNNAIHIPNMRCCHQPMNKSFQIYLQMISHWLPIGFNVSFHTSNRTAPKKKKKTVYDCVISK